SPPAALRRGAALRGAWPRARPNHAQVSVALSATKRGGCSRSCQRLAKARKVITLRLRLRQLYGLGFDEGNNHRILFPHVRPGRWFVPVYLLDTEQRRAAAAEAVVQQIPRLVAHTGGVLPPLHGAPLDAQLLVEPQRQPVREMDHPAPDGRTFQPVRQRVLPQ